MVLFSSNRKQAMFHRSIEFNSSNIFTVKKEEIPDGISSFLAEWEGFEPSRRFWRPTPLAGEPLRPLGYHSEWILYSLDCQSILAYCGCFVKPKNRVLLKRNNHTLDFWKMKWYHLAHTERCPSGLRSQSWKLVMGQPTVGSNPTLSAIKMPPAGGYFFMVKRSDSKGRHQFADWCNQVSGEHLVSPWEEPCTSGCIP